MYQTEARTGSQLRGYEDIIGRTYGHLSMKPKKFDKPCDWQVDRVGAGLITFSRVLCNASFSSHVSVDSSVDSLKNIVIMCVEEGIVEYKERFRHEKCSKKTIMLMNTGKKMEAGQDGAVDVYSATLPTHLLARNCPQIEQLCGIPSSSESGLGIILRDMVKVMTEERGRRGRQDPSCFVGIFGSLLNNIYTKDSDFTQDARLLMDYKKRIDEVITANIRNPDLCPPLIAKNLGVSVSYLYNISRRLGIGLESLIIDMRLDYCRDSLESVNWVGKAISEIAYYWGFKDLSHFSRRFSLKFGESPKKFRAGFSDADV